MTFERIRRSVAEFLEQVFVPREVFFRSGDRFHHLRFSVRSQQVAVTTAILVVAWGLYATVGYVVHRITIADRNKEIAEQRLAYFDLLSEVGEYHTQFSRITSDLEENQAYLLSLLEQTPRDRKNLADIQKQLKSSETEQARVVIAREGLRERMQQFESELLQMAGKNISLQSQLARMQGLLEDSKAERDQVFVARAQVVAKLTEVELALDRMGAAKQELESSVATLGKELGSSEGARQALTEEKSRLTGRVAGLEQELGATQTERETLKEQISGLDASLAKADGQTAELEDQRDLLERRVAGLEQKLGATQAERETLKKHIAGLDASLAKADGQTAELEDQRDLLERRVGGLEQQLVDLRDAGVGVIERLSERTRLSLDVIEKTVRMTGLDVDNLIAQVDHSHLGQGGPFVPAAGGVASFAPSAELGNTVTLLDEQLNRWSALRILLVSLPLTAPLDQYRISSGYGARKDPINGRKAQHRAVDFAAPSGAPVYATAPGKIVFAGWRGRYGRSVEIDHGHGIRTRYAHLRKILVKVGDEVDHRQKIGLVGNSGRSTGPHVHYEVRYQNKARNPMKFLKAGKYVFKG